MTPKTLFTRGVVSFKKKISWMATMASDDEAAPELLESEDGGESGAESFLTEDELAYDEGLDPAEE